MEKTKVDLNTIIANYIVDSASALQTFLDNKLNKEMTMDDINQIVIILHAIELLAKKQAEDLGNMQVKDYGGEVFE